MSKSCMALLIIRETVNNTNQTILINKEGGGLFTKENIIKPTLINLAKREVLIDNS